MVGIVQITGNVCLYVDAFFSLCLCLSDVDPLVRTARIYSHHRRLLRLNVDTRGIKVALRSSKFDIRDCPPLTALASTHRTHDKQP